MAPGKPKRLIREQVERAQRLVDLGYKLKDVAARFGVAAAQLNRYGVRRRPSGAKEKKVVPRGTGGKG